MTTKDAGAALGKMEHYARISPAEISDVAKFTLLCARPGDISTLATSARGPAEPAS